MPSNNSVVIDLAAAVRPALLALLVERQLAKDRDVADLMVAVGVKGRVLTVSIHDIAEFGYEVLSYDKNHFNHLMDRCKALINKIILGSSTDLVSEATNLIAAALDGAADEMAKGAIPPSAEEAFRRLASRIRTSRIRTQELPKWMELVTWLSDLENADDVRSALSDFDHADVYSKLAEAITRARIARSELDRISMSSYALEDALKP